MAFATVPIVVACALAIATALCVALLRRPVHVALGLLGHSLSMAALYMALNAQLSAVAQTLIYAGAIVVLFLIVVALLPDGGAEQLSGAGLLTSLVVGGCVAGLLFAGLATTWQVGGSIPAMSPKEFDVKALGRPLFQQLLVSFELTAPLLLAAIVAAIALWRRQERA
jgi:NADH-quinone oxidoreductase subunit J